MTTEAQKLEYIVEGDASQATRAVNDLASDITRFIEKVQHAENRLGQLFTGTLPAHLRELQNYVQTLNGMSPRAAGEAMSNARRYARNISTGGPAALVNNATFQGLRANIRDDQVLMRDMISQDMQKVRRAYRRLFDEVRATLPQDSDFRTVSTAYLQAVEATGARPQRGAAGARGWTDRTRRMALDFERDWTATVQRETEKRTRAHLDGIERANREEIRLQTNHQRELRRLFQRDMGTIMVERDAGSRQAAYRDSVDRLRTYAGNRGLSGFDEGDFRATYEDAEARRAAREMARDIADNDRRTARAAKDVADAREGMARELDRLIRGNVGSLRQIGDVNRREAAVAGMLAQLQQYAASRGQSGAYDEQRLRATIDAEDFSQGFRNRPERPGPRPPVSPEQRRVNAITGRAQLMGDYMAMGGVMGILGFAGGGVMELERTLRQVQAISGATNGEMAQLQETIFSVGQSTTFSNRELAEGATVMAQAGYSASQIRDALGPVANLASAAGASFADAAATVTSVLSVFDLSIERTSEVSNQMAAALNSSKLSLEQLSLGLQYAGNVAADGGMTFTELTAALGAMADAGIRSGSTMGTGLRALTQELENPSRRFEAWLQNAGLSIADVDVRTRGLAGAIQTLTSHSFDSSAAMGVFEVRAANAFSALSNNLDVLQDLEVDIQGTSAATEGAATQMQSLSAQTQRAGNALIEMTMTSGAPFLAMLTAMFGLVADVSSGMSGWSPVIQLLTTLLGALIAVQVVAWIGRLVSALTIGTEGLKAFSLANVMTAGRMAGLQGAIVATRMELAVFSRALLANPMTWWVAGLTLVTEALFASRAAQEQVNQELTRWEERANEAQASATQYGDRIQELDNYVEQLNARQASLGDGTAAVRQEAERATSRFAEWGLQLENTIPSVDTLTNAVARLRGEMAQAAAEQERLLAEANRQRIERLQEQMTGRSDNTPWYLQSLRAASGDLQRDSATGTDGSLRRAAADALTNPLEQMELSRLGVRQIIQQLFNAPPTDAREISRLIGVLRGARDRASEGFIGFRPRNTLDAVLQALTQQGANASEIGRLQRQTNRAETDASWNELQANPEFQRLLTGDIIGASRRYSAEQERIRRLPQGQQAAALLALQRRRQREFPALQTGIRSSIQQILQANPNIRAGLAGRAQPYNGDVVEAVWQLMLAEQSSPLSSLALGARAPNLHLAPAVLRRQLTAAEAHVNAARRPARGQQVDQAAIRRLVEERHRISEALIRAQNQDADPIALDEMIRSDQEAYNTRNETSLRRAGDREETAEEAAQRRRDRARAATLRRENDTLRRQIDRAMGGVDTSTTFQAPVNAPISSGYGMRRHPVTGRMTMHNGVDYPAGRGVAIGAMGAGVVSGSGFDRLNGNWIEITHPDGSKTKYLHMQDAATLASGASVQAGQTLGRVGSTGRSTGPHLHVQARNAAGQIVDPSSLVGQTVQGRSQADLQAMTERWRTNEIERIRLEGRAGNASEEEIRQRLADFETGEGRDFVNRVLLGDIEASKRLIAEESQRVAEEGAAARVARLRDGSSDLTESLRDTQVAYQQALQDAIEASDARFQAAGNDPQTFGEAIARRAELQREFLQKTTEASLDMLEAFYAGEQARMQLENQRAAADIRRRRGRISALSNPFNTRYRSDVHRQLGALEGENIDLDEATNARAQAQAALLAGVANRDRLQAAYDSAPDDATRTAIADNLREANDQVRELQENFDLASEAFDTLTAQAPEFRGWTETITAAWRVFTDQAQLAMPVFEKIANGLGSVFERGRSGLATMIKDVMTGTKSMGDAFSSFALSVLDSLMDLASKIMAEQIILFAARIIGSMFGGAPGVGGSTVGNINIDTSSIRFAQGGRVPRRYAQGGSSYAPFRDSVPAYLQPDEFVLNRSAVSMVGVEQLERINSMGSRRIGEMPTVQQAMQRDPDMVNVWIVPPTARPQMGKKDIVAAITEDLSTGGATKKLVKAIQVGAM